MISYTKATNSVTLPSQGLRDYHWQPSPGGNQTNVCLCAHAACSAVVDF